MRQGHSPLMLWGAAGLLTLVTACGGPGSREAGADPDAKASDASAAPGGSQANAAPRSPAIPAAPTKRKVTVPSGTVISVSFEQSLSSANGVAGDTFSARVVEPVSVEGAVVIGRGASVTGAIVEAVPSKKIGGKAKLNLDFKGLTLASGERVPITASLYAEGKSQTKKDAATIGGAAAGGAVLGRVIGHRKGKEADGTTIGAVVGAAVGTAIAASKEGEEVTIPAGTTLDIRLDAPLTLTIG